MNYFANLTTERTYGIKAAIRIFCLHSLYPRCSAAARCDRGIIVCCMRLHICERGLALLLISRLTKTICTLIYRWTLTWNAPTCWRRCPAATTSCSPSSGGTRQQTWSVENNAFPKFFSNKNHAVYFFEFKDDENYELWVHDVERPTKLVLVSMDRDWWSMIGSIIAFESKSKSITHLISLPGILHRCRNVPRFHHRRRWDLDVLEGLTNGLKDKSTIKKWY